MTGSGSGPHATRWVAKSCGIRGAPCAANETTPSRGSLAVRPVMTVSVSFDHRVVDGARGAEFLDTLASFIEEPAGLVE